MAIDPDSLVIAQQMRRGIETNPVARNQQNTLKHGTDRTLAIGASNRDDGNALFDDKRLLDMKNPLQTKLNGHGMLALDMRQPLRQGLWNWIYQNQAAGIFCNKASNEASRSRNSRRSTIMSSAPLPSKNSAR